MSRVMHPVGPRSEGTYWIRRVALTVVALLVLIGIVWWLVGRGSGSGVDPAAADTSVSSTPELTGVLATDTSTTTPTGSGSGPTTTPKTDGRTTAGTAKSGTASGDKKAGKAKTGKKSAQKDKSSSKKKKAGKKTAKSGDKKGAGKKADKKDKSSSHTSKSGKKGTKSGDKKKSGDKHGSSAGGKNASRQSGSKHGKHKTTKSTKAPSSTAPPSPSYDASGRLICPSDSVAIKAIGWASTFVVGSEPRIGMSVTNTGDKACMQDVSGASQVYTVYTASGHRVWSTNDCFPGTGHAVRRLAPGATANFIVVWSGTTSSPGCDAQRVAVKPGKYKLVAQLGDIKSKPMAFTMRP